MVSIGALRYDIIADTRQFTSGMVASRRELRSAKKAFLDTRTPIENFGIEIDGMAKLLDKGAIDVDTFGRSFEELAGQYKLGEKEQRDFANSLREQADEIKRTATETGKLTMADQQRATNLRRAAAQADKSADATKAQRLEQERLEREQEQAAQAAREQAQATERLNRIMERGKETTRRFETATEKADRELRDLREELRSGAISQSTYRRAVDRTNKELREQSMAALDGIPVVGRMSSALGAVNPVAAVATAGIAGLTAAMYASVRAGQAFARAISEQMTQLDELAKSARKIGATTQGLAGLRMAAAEFSGMEAAQVDKALQRMTRRLAEAAAGTGEAKQALREMGIDASQVAKMAPADAFRELSDAISEVEDPAQQLRFAFKLFDSEGAALINTLRGGRDALDSVQAEAERLGVAVNEVDLAKIEAANDAMGRVSMAVEGLVNQFAIEFAPVIEDVSKALTELFADRGDDIEAFVEGVKIARNELKRMVDIGTGDSTGVARSFLAGLAPGGEVLLGGVSDDPIEDYRDRLQAEFDKQRKIEEEQRKKRERAIEEEKKQELEKERKAEFDKQVEINKQKREQRKKENARRVAEEKQSQNAIAEQAIVAAKRVLEERKDAAKKAFEEERQLMMQRKMDVAAGPGGIVEIGSTQELTDFANRRNQEIADSIFRKREDALKGLQGNAPEDANDIFRKREDAIREPKNDDQEDANDLFKVIEKDEKLLKEARRQLGILQKQSQQSEDQTRVLESLLAEAKENGFRRVR